MDWTFQVKRKVKCPGCKGAGFLPVEGDTGSPGVTIETECKKCKGHKQVWVKEDLPIESLKELLK